MHTKTADTQHAGQVPALALAPCYLSVPVGELEELHAFFERECVEHREVLRLCATLGLSESDARHRAASSAYHDAATRLRLLMERARKRHPTDNVRNEPRDE